MRITDEQLAEKLLADFNYYRSQTVYWHEAKKKNQFVGPRKFTAKTRDILLDLVEWCRERAIEPRLWMFGLFKLRAWNAAPQMARGHLCSARLIEKYRAMSGIGFFEVRMRATNAEDARVEVFDPNRDMTVAVEALKRRFATEGNHATCLAQQLQRTLGYHPRSAVCQSCPLKVACAVELQANVHFDILALRDGRLNSKDARRIQGEPSEP